MKIVAYTDSWSVAPESSIGLMVSASVSPYDVEVVRLSHGDTDPRGPGFKSTRHETEVDGRYPGREQELRPGSCVRVAHHEAMDFSAGLAVHAFVLPTRPGSTRQTIMSKGRDDGFWLGIDAEARIRVELGGSGRHAVLTTEAPIHRGSWYVVGFSFTPANGLLRLWKWAVTASGRAEEEIRDERLPGATVTGFGDPLLIAASAVAGPERGGPVRTHEHFNGKIARPRLFGRPLEDGAEQVLATTSAGERLEGLVAAWDFSGNPHSSSISDLSPNAVASTAVNLPTRAVTGPYWDGTEVDYRLAPEHYDAIHFHDDDLEDAGWEPDLEWKIPRETPSGVYAFHLSAGDSEYFAPFVVAPDLRVPRPELAVLLPTLTYLAYGNERYYDVSYVDWAKHTSRPLRLTAEDRHLASSRGFAPSLYDTHSDGSGVCYASRLRPILNLGPQYRSYWNDGARHWAGDLYLVDWLEHEGFSFDVLTDEDLHAGGAALLTRYRTVVTGAHPEYVTSAMYGALEGYVHGGGRLAYLGGNGLVWVTTINPERPHVIEVRKVDPSLTIPALGAGAGQLHHSDTGEPGGWWRQRGRHPERLLGVGHTGANWDRGAGYHRLPDSHDPRAAFIFKGVEDDEVIGDFGLGLGGAASDEFDRTDPELGAPANTLHLATATFPSAHMPAVDAEPDESLDRRRSADMTFYHTDNGGAVFSVGSIGWSSSLSANDYANNVSRISRNVLEGFLTLVDFGSHDRREVGSAEEE
jgi:N,N-dimethylformamidase